MLKRAVLASNTNILLVEQLSYPQKRCHGDFSIEYLDMLCHKKRFLNLFDTMDETWVHHSTPERKEQLKQ